MTDPFYYACAFASALFAFMLYTASGNDAAIANDKGFEKVQCEVIQTKSGNMVTVSPQGETK